MQRVDDFKINGKIDIPISPLIIAKAGGFTRNLLTGVHTITNIGYVYSDNSYSKIDAMYVYLDDENILYNTVVDGVITETFLLQEDFQLTPSSHSEWAEWIGNEGHIGNSLFNINLDDGTTERFTRAIATHIDKHISVLEKLERIMPSMKNRSHRTMLFNRELDSSSVIEWLMLDVIDEKDGAFISIMYGLKFEIGLIEILI